MSEEFNNKMPLEEKLNLSFTDDCDTKVPIPKIEDVMYEMGLSQKETSSYYDEYDNNDDYSNNVKDLANYCKKEGIKSKEGIEALLKEMRLEEELKIDNEYQEFQKIGPLVQKILLNLAWIRNDSNIYAIDTNKSNVESEIKSADQVKIGDVLSKTTSSKRKGYDDLYIVVDKRDDESKNFLLKSTKQPWKESWEHGPQFDPCYTVSKLEARDAYHDYFENCQRILDWILGKNGSISNDIVKK